MPDLPAPEAVAAFAAEVLRLGQPSFGHGTKLAVAVSGGGDSLALMWLAAAAFGAATHVLTVDHGLRADARAECAEVVRLAQSLGLPARVLTLAIEGGANVQANARLARYAALGACCKDLGIDWLLTAHHIDDQAETLLLRLARGSGIGGLSGIRASTRIAGVQVLRPLLGTRRTALQAIVAAAGWAPVQDPSNDDPRFDRTAARRLLGETVWLSPDRLAASAANLAEASAALDWAEQRCWESRARWAAGVLILHAEALPAELRRRLLLRGLAELGAQPRGSAAQRMLARLERGQTATLQGVKATPRAGEWHLAAAPPRRTARRG